MRFTWASLKWRGFRGNTWARTMTVCPLGCCARCRAMSNCSVRELSDHGVESVQEEMARKEGVFAALRAVVRRLRQGPGRYVDVFRHYDFALPYVLPARSGEAEPGILLWFIPDFNVGSGGHLNLFRTIWHLEQMGYTSSIVIGKPVMHHDAQE